MNGAKVTLIRPERFLRFLITGCVNSIFGFVVFSAAIVAGASSWGALLVSSVAGTLFNFLTTGWYVFKDIAIWRVPRFILCYLISYAINWQLLEWLFYWTGNYILSQAILVFPIAVLSYVLMARIAFASRSVEHKHSGE